MRCVVDLYLPSLSGDVLFYLGSIHETFVEFCMCIQERKRDLATNYCGNMFSICYQYKPTYRGKVIIRRGRRG